MFYKKSCFTGNDKTLHLEISMWYLAARIDNAVFSENYFLTYLGTVLLGRNNQVNKSFLIFH